jgi:hypothetical protein
MDLPESDINLIKDPQTWATDCSRQAVLDIDPEAQAAYAQLAEEFDALSAELEGLISGFEALSKRRGPD